MSKAGLSPRVKNESTDLKEKIAEVLGKASNLGSSS